MKIIGALAAVLSLAGRHGTLLAATSIFIGLLTSLSPRRVNRFSARQSWPCLCLRSCGWTLVDLRRH